jgi:hypothetical protein
MKYPPAHLSPFSPALSVLPSFTRAAHSLPSPLSTAFTTIFPVTPLSTAFTHSHPGWGGVSALILSTFNCPPWTSSSSSSGFHVAPLFSRTYELPPPIHRFASPAFSSAYELLFSQLPCFQKHLRCPLLFSRTSQFSQSLSGSLFSTFNFQLSTVNCRPPRPRAIVSHK